MLKVNILKTEHSSIRRIFTILFEIMCMCAVMSLLTSCSGKPEDSEIKEAIMESLRLEAESESDVPVLVPNDMQIPMRKAGKAWAVIWNEDKSVQRNYVIEYDKKDKAFKVVSYTESVFDESTNSYIERK